MEEHDNKKRTAVWLTPGVIRRMDSWLEEDNCKTRSEFIEKALRFYMGYLATEDTSEYLSRALADTLRPDAAGTIRDVQATGVTPVLLTGDHEKAARHIAGELGIGTFRAECLPEDKLAWIDHNQQSGRMV